MIVALFSSWAALATPPADYWEVKERHGCTYYNGPEEADGTHPMRGECHWPELDAARVDALLSQWGDWDLYHRSIVSSDVTEMGEDGTVVTHQLHRTFGISDREATLRMREEPMPGGRRYVWAMSSEQPEPQKGNVVPVRVEGFWEVVPADGGGVDVVYDLKYGPGGRVPGFVVRWFQVSGLVNLVEDFRDYATEWSPPVR